MWLRRLHRLLRDFVTWGMVLQGFICAVVNNSFLQSFVGDGSRGHWHQHDRLVATLDLRYSACLDCRICFLVFRVCHHFSDRYSTYLLCLKNSTSNDDVRLLTSLCLEQPNPATKKPAIWRKPSIVTILFTRMRNDHSENVQQTTMCTFPPSLFFFFLHSSF